MGKIEYFIMTSVTHCDVVKQGKLCCSYKEMVFLLAPIDE